MKNGDLWIAVFCMLPGIDDVPVGAGEVCELLICCFQSSLVNKPCT